MRELDACDLLEIGAGEMLRAADADRTIIELVGMSLGVRDQIFERRDPELLAGDHDDGEVGERRDDLEIARRVVWQMRIERDIGCDRAAAGARLR